MRAIRGDRIAMIFQEPMSSLNPSLTVGHADRRAGERCTARCPGRGLREGQGDLLGKVRIPDAASRLQTWPHQYRAACASAP
jgi:ABC-type microcin C transport system duplicated ATPase subunit YejF